MDKKCILMILDGWGLGNGSKSDVISQQATYFNSLIKGNECAHSSLKCSGEDVGLPEGQMGNSEVGHLNIGAGRIVYQDLVKINLAIKNKSLFSNPVLTDAYKYAKENNKTVHLLGLVGDGGVHALSLHVMALCDMATEAGLSKVFVHALMDGRDTDPRSGIGFMKELNDYLNQKTNAKVATICGRYYTMDRDKRWERIKQGYDQLVYGKGKYCKDPITAIQDSYDAGETDEFIKPVIIVDDANKPLTTINEGDVVICYNYRTDRLRQITTVLTQKSFPEFEMKTIPLYYLTMTKYDETFKGIHVVYDKDDVKNSLGEIISKAGKKQIRIAETEKYAHVTFFFSGGRESEFPGEKRILISSPKVATYDLKPSMSALEVKDAIIPELKKGETDFICLNFANGDMVGHTGIYDAIVTAVKTVDSCIKEVIDVALKNNYSVIIIADHGNADYTINEDGSPNTAHSLNDVPCLLFDKDFKNLKKGKLSDVAPTILTIMNMEVPKEMTGEVLVS